MARSYRHGNGNSLTDWGSREAVVPYVFAKGIHEADKDVFRREMQRIKDFVPCITFNEIFGGPVPWHHLEIQVGNKLGCYREKCWNNPFQTCRGYNVFGWVDKDSGYGDKVILHSTTRLANTAWCAELQPIKGFVLHELMHVLGIQHTQKRSDRDKYVKVNDEYCVKADSNSQHQYAKTKEGELHNYDVPYKCNSIMHYRDDQLARNNCKTLVAKTYACEKEGFGNNVAIDEDWQLLRRAHCER